MSTGDVGSNFSSATVPSSKAGLNVRHPRGYSSGTHDIGGFRGGNPANPKFSAN